MKILTVFVLLFIALIKTIAQDSKYDLLLKTLGIFPNPPELEIDTLEKIRLENGIRYKIEYLVEKSDTVFDEPADRVKAYLFIPNHKETDKLPAIIAIHQDANNTHLGKLEPAGLDISDSYPDQKYGLELFKRGYIVICPDRFGHAERRRIPSTDTTNIDKVRDGELYTHRVGQLLLKGRNSVGKEVYDLMRAVDVLYSLDCVDTSKIGAIGHSAGGYNLVYFMFADKRIKIGVSSCGFFELVSAFNENEYYKSWATKAIPGLALIGKSSDYLAYLAPRPILLTRGKYEFTGHYNGQERSKAHVKETEKMIDQAKLNYQTFNAEDNIKAIYFDGGHFFTAWAKIQSYLFIDKYLSPKKYATNKKMYEIHEKIMHNLSSDKAFCNLYFPKAKQDHLEYLLCSYNLKEYNRIISSLQKQKRDFKIPVSEVYSNIEFNIYAPEATIVFIRASFNNWNNEALEKQNNGFWTITKKLKKGIYTYGYFIDNKFSLEQNCDKYYGPIGEKLCAIEIK